MEGPQVGVVRVKVSGRAHWAWVGAVSTAARRGRPEELLGRHCPLLRITKEVNVGQRKQGQGRALRNASLCGPRDEVGPAKSSVRREAASGLSPRRNPQGMRGSRQRRGKSPAKVGVKLCWQPRVRTVKTLNASNLERDPPSL